MSAAPGPTALALQALARALARGAHSADALLVEEDSLEARVRGTGIDFVRQARERCLGLRVFTGRPGRLSCASASTRALSREALERLADETLALAAATAPDPAAGLPEDGYADDLSDLALADPADRAVSAEARIADARRAERAARETDPRIVNSEGSEATSDFRRVTYASSAGFAGSYEAARHGLACMPIAREGTAMQTDYWSTSARALSRLDDAAAVGRTAARRAVRRLGGRRVPTCEVPVIFDPRSARSLIAQLASCLSGTAVYRETSFLAGRLGSSLASDRVTLIDDGRLPGGLASRPFDGEGQPTRRNVLVRAGRLESYLLDSYAARKLGLRTTGSAARATGGGPTAGPTNLWLEPGGQSPEEIVAGTERGLLVTFLFGHGFNPVTGDLSRGAAGLWIEDGELRFPVEEVTIAGNLGEMLAAVDAVGDDLLWLGPVAAPSLRVARMTVAGE